MPLRGAWTRIPVTWTGSSSDHREPATSWRLSAILGFMLYGILFIYVGSCADCELLRFFPCRRASDSSEGCDAQVSV